MVLRAVRACRNGTHMHVHGKNESYARRTLAKLTRLECGTRAGWQCKFIQNSKEPSARSTSPTYRIRVPPILSPSVATLSRRLCLFEGRKTSGLSRKTANYYGRKFGALTILSVSIVKISLPKTRDSEPRESNENASAMVRRRRAAKYQRAEGRARKCKARWWRRYLRTSRNAASRRDHGFHHMSADVTQDRRTEPRALVWAKWDKSGRSRSTRRLHRAESEFLTEEIFPSAPD